MNSAGLRNAERQAACSLLIRQPVAQKGGEQRENGVWFRLSAVWYNNQRVAKDSTEQSSGVLFAPAKAKENQKLEERLL